MAGDSVSGLGTGGMATKLQKRPLLQGVLVLTLLLPPVLSL